MTSRAQMELAQGCSHLTLGITEKHKGGCGPLSRQDPSHSDTIFSSAFPLAKRDGSLGVAAFAKSIFSLLQPSMHCTWNWESKLYLLGMATSVVFKDASGTLTLSILMHKSFCRSSPLYLVTQFSVVNVTINKKACPYWIVLLSGLMHGRQ